VVILCGLTLQNLGHVKRVTHLFFNREWLLCRGIGFLLGKFSISEVEIIDHYLSGIKFLHLGLEVGEIRTLGRNK
jgi:hypothetical protein